LAYHDAPAIDARQDRMEKQTDILSRDTVFRGFLRVDRYRLRHSLFAGGWSAELTRERVEGLRAAAVLLYDPDTDQVVMIEQFRIGAHESGKGAWLLEPVGGYVPPAEDSADVARREAMEEAGCEVADLIPIGEFYLSPGTTAERISLFVGRVHAPSASGIHGLEHEGEDIRVEVLAADDAIRELYTGRANSTTAIITLQWLAMNRRAVRDRWGSRTLRP
jgi:ADP-ribose pyrophosphatase